MEREITFRERPDNIDDKGKRKNLKVVQPKGKWYQRRQIVAWLLLAGLIIFPFLKVNGHPFMLLDIAHRKFFLFGAVFQPQDTFILALIMAVSVVSVVIFTTTFGRLWCGWACPQTVFLEFVYRQIEYWFEGNYRKGKRKEKSQTRSFFMYLTYVFVTLFFVNMGVMWFTGPEGWLKIMQEPMAENAALFSAMFVLTVAYTAIYSYFREQVCTMWCPYGRMQSVLADSKTINVIYDYKRGEPRGSKNEGDCIACNRCVSVCPTGIDIKNGAQLECVSCTSCIDECNQVMTAIGKPKNLIRYDSYEGIEKGERKLFNKRVIAYSLVLLALFTVLGITLTRQTDVATTLLRMPGTLYQQVDDNTLSNLYRAKIVNHTSEDLSLNFKLLEPSKGEAVISQENASVVGNSNGEFVVVVQLPISEVTSKSVPIKIGVYHENVLLEEIESNFIGPN